MYFPPKTFTGFGAFSEQEQFFKKFLTLFVNPYANNLLKNII